MYKILVFTDHKTHGKWESIYKLLSVMSKSDYYSSIYVATRSEEKNSLFFKDYLGAVFCKCLDNKYLYTEEGVWYKDGEFKDPLAFDVIFLRLDRPVTNYQLKKIKYRFSGKTIINDPDGLIGTLSREYLLNFHELCPEIRICKTIDDVKEEIEMYPIVLKPIHGYGGEDFIRVDKEAVWFQNNKVNLSSGLEKVKRLLSRNKIMLSMRFLQNVSKGDNRIIVVGEKILGATLRLPANGSWLCNLKQGGTAVFSKITDNERYIAKIITPDLRKKGVLIFGFDTLEDDTGKRVLSEINTLNVGGLLQAEDNSGKPIVQMAADQIWKYILKKTSWNGTTTVLLVLTSPIHSKNQSFKLGDNLKIEILID